MKLRVASAVFVAALSARMAVAQDATPESSPSPTPTAIPAASFLDDPFAGGEDAPPQFFGEEAAAVTRSAERVEDAPGLIAVIGEREIRERGYRTLADLLADVPGFYVEPDERRSVVLTRGVPQSVLIVYDGIPLVFSTGRDDLPIGEELSLAHVRRVEVLRGPGTALWGANAFNGIVNVVSQDGRGVDGVRFVLEGGTSREGETLRRGATLQAGKRDGRLEWSLAARALAEDGSDRSYLDSPHQYVLMNPVSIPVGPFQNGPGEPGASSYAEAVAKVSWRKFSFVSRWSDFVQRGALSSYSHSLLEEDRNERRRVPTFSARAGWSSGRGPATWTVGAFYLRSLHDDRFPLFAIAPAHRYGGEIDVRAQSDNVGVDARGDFTWGRQSLSGGVLASEDTSTLATDYTDPQTGTRTTDAFRRRFRNTVLQVYAQDRITFAERWRLTLGASFDDQSDFAPSINPRAGLVVRMGRGWIAKALYGEAIRTPDAYDLIGISGGAAVGSIAAVSGNPDLRPEKIRTGELAAEFRRGSVATASMAGYFSRTDDLIEDSASSGDVTPVNRGERFSTGLEFHGKLAPSNAVSLHGSYAVVRVAEDSKELFGSTLPAAPRYVVSLGGAWSPRPDVSLYAGNRFVSRRPLRAAGERNRLGPYVRTDLNLRYAPPAWPVSAALQVRNAFDVRHYHRNEAVAGRNVAVEIPGDRRGVVLTIEGKF